MKPSIKPELKSVVDMMMSTNQKIKNLENSIALAVKRGISEKARERMEEHLDDYNDLFISLVNQANNLTQ